MSLDREQVNRPAQQVSAQFKYVVVEKGTINDEAPLGQLVGRWSDRSPLPTPQVGKPYKVTERPTGNTVVDAKNVKEIITASPTKVELKTDYSRYVIYLSHQETPQPVAVQPKES